MTRLLCALVLVSTAAFAEDPWVLVRDPQRVTMSGDLKNLDKARKYLAKFGPGYLWFRHAGKEYLVRDGKLLRQVEDVAQGEGTTAAQEALLEAQEQELERHQQRLEQHQAAIEEWEDSADREKLSTAQERLNRAQEEVNRAQEKLARAQEKLGRVEEQRSKEMERKMAALIAAALRDGKAQEVK